MKGQTEIKSAQHLKDDTRFAFFVPIVWDRLVLDPSWLNRPLWNIGGRNRSFSDGIDSDSDFGSAELIPILIPGWRNKPCLILTLIPA